MIGIDKIQVGNDGTVTYDSVTGTSKTIHNFDGTAGFYPFKIILNRLTQRL